MVKILKILPLFLAVTMNTINAYIVLCDLGGTFVDVNELTYAIQELGIGNILLNGFTNKFQFNPRKKIFAVLDKIEPRTSNDTITHDNTLLPKIYCDWMAGNYKDAQETRTMILERVDSFHKENFFETDYEYTVVRNAIEAMFTPEKLVKHQYAIEPMFKILERIDLTQHKIVIVSNWDQHSFPLFLESPLGQRLCKYIKKDDMIVSGYIGANKPHPDFYTEIFKKYGSPEKTDYIFLDNEPRNIAGAQAHNIPSVHYTKGNHKLIEEELISRGIITPAA